MLIYNFLLGLVVLKDINGVFMLPHLLKDLLLLQIHFAYFHTVISRLLNDPLNDRVVEGLISRIHDSRRI